MPQTTVKSSHIDILTINHTVSSQGEQISNLRLQPQIEICDESEDRVVVEHKSFSSNIAQLPSEDSMHLTDTQPDRSMTVSCEIDMTSGNILDVNRGGLVNV